MTSAVHNPDGSVSVSRITTDGGISNGFDLTGPNDMDSFFDHQMPEIAGPRLLNPFFSFLPMNSRRRQNVFNFEDIVEISMREAQNNGVPPASDEAISSLEVVDVKDGEEQCPI